MKLRLLSRLCVELSLDSYDALCDWLDSVSARIGYVVVLAMALYLIWEACR